MEDVMDAKGARVGRRATCRLMNTPTHDSTENQIQSISLWRTHSETMAGRKKAQNMSAWLFQPKKEGETGLPPTNWYFPQAGRSVWIWDYFQAGGDAWPCEDLHGANTELGMGQDLGLGCCGKDEHSRSKAAFCRLGTAPPFSTKPINYGPTA